MLDKEDVLSIYLETGIAPGPMSETGGVDKLDTFQLFKHRNNYAATNGSGNTFIYMAFAEQPGITSFDTFPNAR